VTILLVVIAYAVLWFVARPSDEPWGRHIGQLLGVESIVLLSLALVLISTLPWVEEWFDGIDRAAVWHRRIAIIGLVLLVPHLALASNPNGTALGAPLGVIGLLGLVGLAVWAVMPRWRMMVPRALHGAILTVRELPGVRHVRALLGGYERWRALHKTTGLFVAAGFVHGLLDATAFGGSPALRWSYVGIGGLGVGFYLYRELLARFFLSLHDFQVHDVRVVQDGMVEVALTPLGRPLRFVPGQFAMLYLEAKDGWLRHPFTIASAPQDPTLRFTIKALGDATSGLQDWVEPGMPAVIGGPHGRFDRGNGTDRQVWIGGGVGVTPFLSWLRTLAHEPLTEHVDFFYSSEGPAPFADEVSDIADQHPTLTVHLVDSGVEGFLTPQRVIDTVGPITPELSVFLCGPHGMVTAFRTALRRAGVPRTQIHHEHFTWR
jgi:predicted ferric reductase